MSLLIPQQPPFVMIDTLLYADETISRTAFAVRADNVLVEDGHFTAAGLMENMAQTAAAGAGYTAQKEGKPVQVGFIASVSEFEVHQLTATGDELVTEVTFKERVMNISVVSGIVKRNNEVIASCEMKIVLDG